MSTHNAAPRPATVGSSANVFPRKSLGYFLGGATALAVLLGSAGSAFAKGPRACNAYASGDTASVADVKKTLDDSKMNRILCCTACNREKKNRAPADVPQEDDLLRLFFRCVPDEAVRRKILVDNPSRLYGF